MYKIKKIYYKNYLIHFAGCRHNLRGQRNRRWRFGHRRFQLSEMRQH